MKKIVKMPQDELDAYIKKSKQRRITLCSGTDENEGEMLLSIHDKNGKVHSSWKFASPEEVMEFADMMWQAAKRYQDKLTHSTDNPD